MRGTHAARISGLAAMLLILLAGSACAPIQTRTESRIATLRVSGPNVTINGRAAVDGQAYYEGETLATGPASSARLEFPDGGTVQLDENTDFSVERIKEAVGCIFRVLFTFGRTDVDDGSTCRFQPDTPQLAGLTESEVIVESSRESATVTLFHGSFRLLRPTQTRLQPGEQIQLAGGRVIARRMLTRAELHEVRAWVDRYEFPRLTSVPTLQGLDIDAAYARLERAGLRPGQVKRQPAARYRADTVVGQMPTPGTRVRPGTIVNLTVASGPLPEQPPPGAPSPEESAPQMVVVPNLVGAVLGDARRFLERAGLRPGRIAEVTNPRYRPGTVVRLSPNPGTRVPPGTQVNLYVAKVQMVRVPSLLRLDLSRAQRVLAQAGFELGRTVRQPAPRGVAPGTVLGQSPPAGSLQPRGTPVDVQVAVADLVTVPSVIGRYERDARRLLSQAGLGLRVVETRVVGGGFKTGQIFEQNPRPGTRLQRGATVNVRVQGTLY